MTTLEPRLTVLWQPDAFGVVAFEDEPELTLQAADFTRKVLAQHRVGDLCEIPLKAGGCFR
jgi:hypothetical protein